MNTMSQERLTFPAGEETLAAIKLTDKTVDKVHLLLLHGGGTSNKERYLYLAQELVGHGIGSLSIDFSGHGESTGITASSSLAKRAREASAALAHVEQPRAVCGSSMGAYTAVKLTQDHPIQTLILFNPAMYTRQAYDVPFAAEFTRLIREPQSWRNSDAWEILENFRGRLLIVIGDKDEVIPPEIITLLDTHSPHVKEKEIIIIPDCTHNIHEGLAKNPAIKERVVETMVRMINN